MRDESKEMQNLFSECVLAYMTICLKQVDILEGVNILGKQGTHRSKTYNGFTHTHTTHKTRKHKHNTKDNHQTTKSRGTKKKYKINGKTIFKLAINR